MAKSLVKFKLHGNIWNDIPSEWEVMAKSLGDCLRLVEMNTKKLYATLYLNDLKNIRYEIIINGRKLETPKIETVEDINNSELVIKYDKLETVDVIPIIEGADSDIFQAIFGVILIIVGAIVSFTGIGAAVGVPIIGAGLTLLASGVVGLLTKPPKFEDFREIEQGGRTSYLFAGPANIIGEGGPVPVGYGRLIVGSQVISAAYVIRDFNTDNTSIYLRDEYGNLLPLNKVELQ